MVNTGTVLIMLFALPAAAAFMGAARGETRRPDMLILVPMAVAGVALGLLALTAHDPDVPVYEAVEGVALAALLLGALPVYGFFTLGRALAGRRIILVLACLGATLPVAYLYFIGWIAVLALVHCPPDAYECPV
jgi:hypothetical protein